KQIMAALALDERDYGQVESVFAIAFAIGAIVAGWMVDRWSVYWIYPLAVLAWSFAGFATGLAGGFLTLLLCRFFLGLAESGNWPCALRTTQRILTPAERSLGNSILQSGAAIGAVCTPPLVLGLRHLSDTWRSPFFIVGVLGVFWVVLWFRVVRREDLVVQRPPVSPDLTKILGWLVLLYTLDLGLHALAKYHAGWEELPVVAWFPPALRPRLPLYSKITVTVLAIGGVVWWLHRATCDDPALPRGLFFRRFAALATLVIAINLTWHYFRVWLPLFLQNSRAYTEQQTQWFATAYYISADA